MKGMEGDALMSSTKMMFLGVLIMLLGLGLDSEPAQFVTERSMGFDVAANLVYVAAVLLVAGFIIGVIGLFFRY